MVSSPDDNDAMDLDSDKNGNHGNGNGNGKTKDLGGVVSVGAGGFLDCDDEEDCVDGSGSGDGPLDFVDNPNNVGRSNNGGEGKKGGKVDSDDEDDWYQPGESDSK